MKSVYLVIINVEKYEGQRLTFIELQYALESVFSGHPLLREH